MSQMQKKIKGIKPQGRTLDPTFRGSAPRNLPAGRQACLPLAQPSLKDRQVKPDLLVRRSPDEIGAKED